MSNRFIVGNGCVYLIVHSEKLKQDSCDPVADQDEILAARSRTTLSEAVAKSRTLLALAERIGVESFPTKPVNRRAL